MQRFFTLPIDVARCIAPNCSKADHFAPHEIPAGQQGRALADHSNGTGWSPATCRHYIAVSQAVDDTAKKPARPVHKPIGSEA